MGWATPYRKDHRIRRRSPRQPRPVHRLCRGLSLWNRHQLHLRCLAHQRDADRHRWCAFGERHPSGQVRHLEFRKVNDGSGHLEIIDPTTVFTGPLVISGGSSLVASNGDIGAGAATTLGYSANGSGTGGTLAVSDGTRAATIALLGNYIAGTFVTAADGHGGTLVTAAPTANAPLLTTPHP